MNAINRIPPAASPAASQLGQGLSRIAQAAGAAATATATGTSSPKTISQAGLQALAGAGQVAQSAQDGAGGLVKGVKQAAVSAYSKVAALASQALKG